ncbi:MAG: hypothetical protein U0165_01865 [Polyangiaceae bacterium]
MSLRAFFSARVCLLLVPAIVGVASSARAQGIRGSGVVVDEIRVALAQHASSSTTWIQARTHSLTPESTAPVVWTLVVPPSTTVDLVPSSWLDALESATAPRVLAPWSAKPSSECEEPTGTGVSVRGDVGPTQAIEGVAIASSVGELSWIASSWGVSVMDVSVPSSVWANSGTKVLVLKWRGHDASVALRLHGPSASLPLWGSATTPTTVWVIGDERRTLSGVSEGIVKSTDLWWMSPTTTTYETVRQSLLDGGRSVIECAGMAPLSRDVLSAGDTIEGALSGYVRRSIERGEASGETDTMLARAKAQLEKNLVLASPCGRGDLVNAGCVSEVGASSSELVTGAADDLAFAFSGSVRPSERWVTRLSSRASETSAATLVSQPSGVVSAVRSPLDSWTELCPAIEPGTGGSGGTSSGASGSSGSSGSTGASGASGGSGTNGAAGSGASGHGGKNGAGGYAGSGYTSGVGGSDSTTGEDVAAGIEAAATVADAANGCFGSTEPNEPEESDDSDSCSGDSSSDESSDSCSGSSSDSSSGDSCDSSSSGSSDSGCSSSSGSSSGSGDCSVSRRGRRRTKLSQVVLGLAAMVLPLRRMTCKKNVRTRGC